MEVEPPTHWKAPIWHADWGDPSLELEPLRALALKLLRGTKVTVTLETPEPGMLYLRGSFSDGRGLEIHSVASIEHGGSRRFAVFMKAGAEETEDYFDSLEEAAAFLLHRG